MAAGGNTIKVNSDELSRQASVILDEIRSIETSWNQMNGLVNKMQGYWKGAASDMHLEKFHGNEDDVVEVLKRLKEHPVDLLKILDLYTQTETDLEQMAVSLPTDVIF